MKTSLLLLSLAACTLIVGCGSDTAKAPQADSDALRIGIVFDSGGRGDKSFNDSAWAGIERAKKELGIQEKAIDTRSAKDYEGNLNSMAEQGMDLVFSVGYTQAQPLKAAAAKNPDTKFAFVDDEVDEPNVKGLKFREEQGSFLAGYLAGLVSKTKKIGFVGGMSGALIKKFEVGYIAGAKAADPSIQVLPPKYTESWDDVSQGKAAAKLLFAQGADIVFHAAGRSGIGVIDAAEEAGEGKFAIGVDSDQDGLKPGHVLTSMVKRVDVAVFETIKDLKDGKWTGETRVFDLESGGVGLTDFKYTRDVIGPDNIKRVEEMKERIIGGEVVVPTNDEELKTFESSLASL